jgi:hypothetical protein
MTLYSLEANIHATAAQDIPKKVEQKKKTKLYIPRQLTRVTEKGTDDYTRFPKHFSSTK